VLSIDFDVRSAAGGQIGVVYLEVRRVARSRLHEDHSLFMNFSRSLSAPPWMLLHVTGPTMRDDSMNTESPRLTRSAAEPSLMSGVLYAT
jgi:hypothetical protein